MNGVAHIKLVDKKTLLLMGILLGSAAIKGGLVLFNRLPFNADEAIVGLMARHILAGERPVFFYGQAYMGSLDAFLVAFSYLLVGEQVWAIRAIQSLLYLGTIYTTYRIGIVLLGSARAGLIAACLVAVPTVNVTLYTTISLGGYGEALLIGNGLVLCSLKIARDLDSMLNAGSPPAKGRKPFWPWAILFLFGCLAGLGLWANGLTLVFLIPASGYLLYYFGTAWQKRSLARSLGALLLVLAGFFTGSLPWWSFAIHEGLPVLIHEFFGSAVAVERGSWLSQALSHLVNFMALGVPAILGMRPPWEVRWLVLPMIPLIVFAWGWLAYHFIKMLITTRLKRPENLLMVGIMAMVVAGFLSTPFGVDPSGRYFLPFVVPMSLIAADGILTIPVRLRWLSVGLFGVILIYQLGGTIQSALRNPPGLTTQFDASTIIDHTYDGELIRFLEAQGETVGYTNYWIAYPVAFLSQEKVILVPRLPYHQDFRYTARDDRYAPYDDWAAHSPTVVYVTVHNPALDNRLRAAFSQSHIRWQEKKIGDYQIFYRLTKAIRPEQMDLGLILTK